MIYSHAQSVNSFPDGIITSLFFPTLLFDRHVVSHLFEVLRQEGTDVPDRKNIWAKRRQMCFGRFRMWYFPLMADWKKNNKIK